MILNFFLNKVSFQLYITSKNAQEFLFRSNKD